MREQQNYQLLRKTPRKEQLQHGTEDNKQAIPYLSMDRSGYNKQLLNCSHTHKSNKTYQQTTKPQIATKLQTTKLPTTRSSHRDISAANPMVGALVGKVAVEPVATSPKNEKSMCIVLLLLMQLLKLLLLLLIAHTKHEA